jgi:phospholipid/cholesterol/gamma-HCH transport system substrate-binding protein
MKNLKLEFFVGVFFIVGLLALIYMSVELTRFEMKTKGGYTVKTTFENAGGLKVGSNVEIAGVPIGIVKQIELREYKAVVTLHIIQKVQIPDDSMVAIKTKGLLGEKYVEVSPGASETPLKSGSEIMDTQSPIDFEKALGKYIFGKVE